MSSRTKNRRPRVAAQPQPQPAPDPVDPATDEATEEAKAEAADILARAEAEADKVRQEASDHLRDTEEHAARVRAEADVKAARIVSLAEKKATDIESAAHTTATERTQARVTSAVKAAEDAAEEVRGQARRQAEEIRAAAEEEAVTLKERADKIVGNAVDTAAAALQDAKEKAAKVRGDAQRQARLLGHDTEALFAQARTDSEKAAELRTAWEAKAKTKPPRQKPALKEGETLPLSTGEIALFLAVIVFSGAVGTLGLYSSFDALAAKGAEWHFGGGFWILPDGWILPVGIDVAIPAFTGANLLLIRTQMPLAWVRFVPWALTGVTGYLNWKAASSGETAAQVAHGVMPMLWVVLSEVAAHAYATHIGALTGTRMDKIRLSRWLLSPGPTFLLWRRMVMTEETSYARALVTEGERQKHNAGLRTTYGFFWWFPWVTPKTERFATFRTVTARASAERTGEPRTPHDRTDPHDPDRTPHPRTDDETVRPARTDEDRTHGDRTDQDTDRTRTDQDRTDDGRTVSGEGNPYGDADRTEGRTPDRTDENPQANDRTYDDRTEADRTDETGGDRTDDDRTDRDDDPEEPDTGDRTDQDTDRTDDEQSGDEDRTDPRTDAAKVDAARRAYAASLNTGKPLGPTALARTYGFSEGWGRKQIRAVRTELGLDERRHLTPVDQASA
ncbi:DUF2637 domain-containing protein [Streptomyces sp. NPDC090085]|uniref:DUF2637 domain-containing protein n=1 Tax=Streptomyces sp. NPDC090085 TaxID=3365943 RepID=UPI00381839CD